MIGDSHAPVEGGPLMDRPTPLPAWMKLAAATIVLALVATLIVVAITQDEPVARTSTVERAPRLVQPEDRP